MTKMFTMSHAYIPVTNTYFLYTTFQPQSPKLTCFWMLHDDHDGVTAELFFAIFRVTFQIDCCLDTQAPGPKYLVSKRGGWAWRAGHMAHKSHSECRLSCGIHFTGTPVWRLSEQKPSYFHSNRRYRHLKINQDFIHLKSGDFCFWKFSFLL